MTLNESIVEDTALEWFGELGCALGMGCLGNLRKVIIWRVTNLILSPTLQVEAQLEESH
jgi:hypothetical protein